MELVSSRCKGLFETGRLLITPGALEATKKAGQGLEPLIDRHKSGDWGDMCEADVESNNAAIDGGTRIMSSYEMSTGRVVWLVTESDRSATTILMPDEY
jgi:hypothetical protein